MSKLIAASGGLLARVSRHLGWATLTVLVAGATVLAAALMIPKANGCIVLIELAGSWSTMRDVLVSCARNSGLKS